ncbi:MAG: hypothetical protein K5924_08360 [Chloroflexi bacterium]|nr:hypothetical protein [Chloroflexota bacterium]
MTATDAAAEALVALQCRDDILQALYWLRGEDPAGDATEKKLQLLLVVDARIVHDELATLIGDGLVERAGDRLRLTDTGVREGGRRFADEFGALTRSAHGDCPPNCPHCADLPRDACDHCLGGDPDGASWARV